MGCGTLAKLELQANIITGQRSRTQKVRGTTCRATRRRKERHRCQIAANIVGRIRKIGSFSRGRAGGIFPYEFSRRR